MKKHLFLLFIFFITINIHTQTNELDSLWTKYSLEKNETKKIDIKLDIAFYYRKFDLEKSHLILKNILKKSKEIKYEHGISESLYNSAFYHYYYMEYDTARSYINKAIKYYIKNNNKKG